VSHVLVIWADAKFDHDYITSEKAQSLRPAITYTLGHLICQNDHGITVAMSSFQAEPDHFSEYLFVPGGMVLEVRELVDK